MLYYQNVKLLLIKQTDSVHSTVALPKRVIVTHLSLSVNEYLIYCSIMLILQSGVLIKEKEILTSTTLQLFIQMFSISISDKKRFLIECLNLQMFLQQ